MGGELIEWARTSDSASRHSSCTRHRSASSRSRQTLRTLVLGPHRFEVDDWSFTLHRDIAPGPFTRATARFAAPTKGVKRIAYSKALADSLPLLPTTLSTIEIEHALVPHANVLAATRRLRADVIVR